LIVSLQACQKELRLLQDLSQKIDLTESK